MNAQRKTIDQLNQEILELKNCQVDMVKLAIQLFTVVSLSISGIAAVVFGFKVSDNNLLGNLNLTELSILVFPIIIIILITPISFPIFMRIIIHKCRSIFRMVGYIRLSEELENHLIIPYEYGYAILRNHPIFLNRMLQNRGLRYYIWDKPKDIFTEMFCPKKKYPKLLSNEEAENLINIYIGRYYYNLGFFLALLSIIHLILFAVISYLILAHNNLMTARIIIIGLDFYIFFWCLYNFMLLRRYFYEIHYYPFSIHSWYCLFKVVNSHYKNKDLETINADIFELQYKKCMVGKNKINQINN